MSNSYSMSNSTLPNKKELISSSYEALAWTVLSDLAVNWFSGRSTSPQAMSAYFVANMVKSVAKITYNATFAGSFITGFIKSGVEGGNILQAQNFLGSYSLLSYDIAGLAKGGKVENKCSIDFIAADSLTKTIIVNQLTKMAKDSISQGYELYRVSSSFSVKYLLTAFIANAVKAGSKHCFDQDYLEVYIGAGIGGAIKSLPKNGDFVTNLFIGSYATAMREILKNFSKIKDYWFGTANDTVNGPITIDISKNDTVAIKGTNNDLNVIDNTAVTKSNTGIVLIGNTSLLLQTELHEHDNHNNDPVVADSISENTCINITGECQTNSVI